MREKLSVGSYSVQVGHGDGKIREVPVEPAEVGSYTCGICGKVGVEI